MRRMIAVMLCAALFMPACATGGAARAESAPAPPSTADPALMASYVEQLPVGSRVRVHTTDGRKLSATLMKADDRAIVVQARTRIPEPPITVPLEQVVSVQLEANNGPGRAIAIGAAAGAGAALGVFLVLLAIFAGD